MWYVGGIATCQVIIRLELDRVVLVFPISMKSEESYHTLLQRYNATACGTNLVQNAVSYAPGDSDRKLSIISTIIIIHKEM